MDVLRINVDLAIFQSYLDLEAGDNQSLKIQVAPFLQIFGLAKRLYYHFPMNDSSELFLNSYYRTTKWSKGIKYQ